MRGFGAEIVAKRDDGVVLHEHISQHVIICTFNPIWTMDAVEEESIYHYLEEEAIDVGYLLAELRFDQLSANNRREKAKTAQLWTTVEEITLCIAWCNAMDNYDTRDTMKRGFWSEIFANFEKEIGGGGLFKDTIPSSSNGNIRFVLKCLRLVSFTIASNRWMRAGLLT
nr:hypothetical protein [Tanacetum cinerariifolium]